MLLWETMVWEDDKEDVVRLAEEQWDSLSLSNLGPLNIDMDIMLDLYEHHPFIGLVGRDEKGVIRGYYVGVVQKFVFQAGRLVLKQITSALEGGMKDYIGLIDAVEKEALLAGADIISISIESERAGAIMKKRYGYEFNDANLIKELT